MALMHDEVSLVFALHLFAFALNEALRWSSAEVSILLATFTKLVRMVSGLPSCNNLITSFSSRRAIRTRNSAV